MKKSRAAMEEDRLLAAEIAKADQFSASIRLGPHDKRTSYCGTYAEAVAAKAALDSESQFGRKAVIYAINRLGSFPVSEELAKLAGLI